MDAEKNGMEGGEGKVKQRLGEEGRAGRDANWRHMENKQYISYAITIGPHWN